MLPLKGEELKRAVCIVETSRTQAISSSNAAKVRFINILSQRFSGMFSGK